MAPSTKALSKMSEYQEVIQIIALTLGVAWASGLNLYAAVAALGLGGATGYVDLPPTLEMLQDPLVILGAGFMYCVEFMADKIPGVDSGWDALHTFIRIPAGAVLAAGAVGDVAPALSVAAGLLGGTVTAVSHATKASSRLLINASPEPFSNWAASLAEDLAVFAGLWAALNHPVLFLLAFIAFVGLVCWLLPKLWKGIGGLLRKIGGWLGMAGDAKTKRLDELQRLADSGLLTETELSNVRARLVLSSASST